MINGEGTGDPVSKMVSPDPFGSFSSRRGSKSDGEHGSPSSSRYSSCGGESEFERYCSANSVMGTPSLCSSVGNYNDFGVDSEFGSMKGFGFGDDGGLENFNLGGRVSSLARPDRLGERRIQFRRGNVCREQGTNDRSGGLELYGNDEMELPNELNCGLAIGGIESGKEETESRNDLGRSDFDKGHMDSGVGGSDIVNIPTKEAGDACKDEDNLFDFEDSNDYGFGESSENVSGGINGLKRQSDLQFDGMDMDGEEDGTSSRYEHSEDEDSMYNYGSDEDRGYRPYLRRNTQFDQEAKNENENPLAMNSSTAFGSNDWDDFEQETAGDPLSSLTMYTLGEQKSQNLDTGRSCSNSTYVPSTEFRNVGQTEQGKNWPGVQVANNRTQDVGELAESINSSITPNDFHKFAGKEQVEDVGGNLTSRSSGDKLGHVKNSSITPTSHPNLSATRNDVGDIAAAKYQVQGADGSEAYLNSCSVSNVFEMEKAGTDCVMERECVNGKNFIDIDDGQIFENLKLQLDPISNVAVNSLSTQPSALAGNLKAVFSEDHESNSFASDFENKTSRTSKKSAVSEDLIKEHPPSLMTENLELNDLGEFYNDIVHDMEEILLDSGESPGPRHSQDNRMFQSQQSPPLRDGGSTASTSGIDDAYPLIHRHLKLDGVEVVGAKQKKGDVSLSERLVGVKEYTVYRIKVWSGQDQWEVERRYRDFFTLYRRLKTFFSEQDLVLPSPWFTVEKESRKIFGNASPNVIVERSVLIQECLQSILHSRIFSSPPSALVWFLSPQDSCPNSPASESNTVTPQSSFFSRQSSTENISTLGKTISLIVEIHPYKSTKQILEAQHYTCAGCHKHFDDGRTLMLEFVQTLGWGKPRLCEYTSQLFCSSCHANDTAVLPAKVLHDWDFIQYPVSQMAKSYLDSIHEQPMLCVSAVNPFLFTKVPALHHVTSVRKKIGTMLPFVRCPFRKSINKGLGSRRYLLESNDFFALKDLIDLSKGAFAALPVMLETVSRKILEHIMEQCLICCDVGVPCGARQACNDPSSLIFPFQQEDEVTKCKSCQTVFHKSCMKKLTNCTCGVYLAVEARVRSKSGGEAVTGTVDLLGGRTNSGLSVGFLSGLFSKAKPEKIDHRDADTVILMGSLPSTTL